MRSAFSVATRRAEVIFLTSVVISRSFGATKPHFFLLLPNWIKKMTFSRDEYETSTRPKLSKRRLSLHETSASAFQY
mgnify:CR=1 FL=1